MKVYQALDLVGIENHKNLWIPGITHTADVQIHTAPVFDRGRMYVESPFM